LGETVSLDWPVITNLRLDPFERVNLLDGKVVGAQEQIEGLVLTFVDYPPMQDPASFNLDAVKKKIEKMRSIVE